MSTLRVNTLQDVAGTGQPAMSGAAKAWVNFNGTGTVAIRAAFNVTSITDLGVARYTVNFTTPLADANYAAVVSGKTASTSNVTGVGAEMGAGYGTTTRSTTQLNIVCAMDSAGPLDVDQVNVVIFR